MPPVVNPSPPKKLALPNPAAIAEANKLANALYPSTLLEHYIKVSFFGIHG
jgi:hypothetical protein